MADQKASGKCRVCGDVLVTRAGTNHILHLILTLITCGFWLLIWILASVKIGGWKCSQCGRSASRSFLG